MKKSFIIHLDSLEILDELSDSQAGKLLRAFRDFHKEKEPDLDQILRIVFVPFKLQFQRDNEKYEGAVIRNSLNGSKGGRPKKATESNNKQENPVGFLGLSKKQPKPKKADNDSVSDNDSKSDNENESENGNALVLVLPAEGPKKKFIKPSIQDICIYVQSKEPMADPILIGQFAEKFHSFYESNGWKVGKNPMKNWKAAIGTWNDTLQKTINPFKESSGKESFPFGAGAKKGSWESRQAEYLKGVQSILNDKDL